MAGTTLNGGGGVTSSALDTLLGATQGSIPMRNGSVWTALPPGAAGYVLQTGGASANPSWVAPSGGVSQSKIIAGIQAGITTALTAAQPNYTPPSTLAASIAFTMTID